MKIEEILSQKAKILSESKPVIFDLNKEEDKASISKLVDENKIHHVVDDYKEQLHELFAVKNPSKVFAPTFKDELLAHIAGLEQEKPLTNHGKWVYFPWISTFVHILDEEDFQLVRTARNKNLINAEEQEKFYNATIGIGGLSVGNSVALAVVLQGGGKRMKLADFDTLALTNTNRVRAGVENLGVRKVEVTARQIYQINPYAEIEIFPDGLTKENISQFFTGLPKLDIVIDELDNLAVKVLIREEAKKNRIAVVMAADNGDNGLVDIERYDLNPETPFFHGRMGDVSYEKLVNLDKMGIGRLIVQHIGVETVTNRVHESMPQIGRTIVSWPQLGGAALLNGSAVAYVVRKILNGQPIEENRALISLDEKLIPSYNSPIQKKKRLQSATAFRKIFG
ncbi:MAG: ThiF family adenylyltransferase [Candidatus Liptonbacteria bacterium]|nr:ThiF family adenylyltransferase [Candidatus Liptonbacteria bacterium]